MRAAVLLLTASSVALGALGGARADGPRREAADRLDRPVWVEHHGSLRLRPELLVGGALGGGASGVPPALAPEGDTSSTLAWASMRLRYEPIVHLGSQLRIELRMDALDNLILGSTHVNAGGSFDRGLWRDAQGVPQAGVNGWEDALKVQRLFGAWRLFDAMDFAAGRFTDGFGLGIVRDPGDGPDADFATVVDGARVAVDIAGMSFAASWEFTSVGATEARRWDGQPKDLGQADDATTYTLRISHALPSAAARHARDLALQPGAVALEWGAFSAFTNQDYTSDVQPAPAEGCEVDTELASGRAVLSPGCTQLTKRGIFLWRPSAWGRLGWRVDARSVFRAELEVAAMVGDANQAQGDPELHSAKRFQGFGLALETEFERGAWALGFDGGLATGDDRRYLGVLGDGSQQNIVEPDDASFDTNDNVRTNRWVSSYWFHRNYRIDLILFRQVIGTVTNAFYLKPWTSYQVLDGPDLGLKLRLDALYAGAMYVKGSPGQELSYGVEVDAHAVLTVGRHLEATLSAGALAPLGGLKDRDTGAAPSPAFAVRGLATWRF